jgi:hypothetical protein
MPRHTFGEIDECRGIHIEEKLYAEAYIRKIAECRGIHIVE